MPDSSPDRLEDIICDVACRDCPRFREALEQAPEAAYCIFAPPLILPILPQERGNEPYDDVIVSPDKFTELPPSLFVRYIMLGGIGIRGTGLNKEGECCAEEKDRITILFT